MPGHFIKKCKECGDVFERCRCTGPHEILYGVCTKCNSKEKTAMEKLSAAEIDQTLINRDQRKPLRKVVDDHIAPAAGVAMGAAGAVAGALGNIKTVNRMREVV